MTNKIGNIYTVLNLESFAEREPGDDIIMAKADEIYCREYMFFPLSAVFENIVFKLSNEFGYYAGQRLQEIKQHVTLGPPALNEDAREQKNIMDEACAHLKDVLVQDRLPVKHALHILHERYRESNPALAALYKTPRGRIKGYYASWISRDSEDRVQAPVFAEPR